MLRNWNIGDMLTEAVMDCQKCEDGEGCVEYLMVLEYRASKGEEEGLTKVTTAR